MPLSPRYVLSLADAREFHFIANRDGLLSRAIPAFVDFYNSLQVIHSTRFVYSCAADFAMAAEMCQKNPNLSDPTQPRIVVQGGPWSTLGSPRCGPDQTPSEGG